MKCLGIDNVQRAVRFITDINAASIRSDGCTVIDFYAFDLSNDLVGGRVDDADKIRRTIRLNDAHFSSACGLRSCLSADPCGQCLPFRILLRQPMLSSIVAFVPTRRFGQWMRKELACHGISGFDSCPDDVEVLARVFLSPSCGARRHRLQTHRRTLRMTSNAASIAMSSFGFLTSASGGWNHVCEHTAVRADA